MTIAQLVILAEEEERVARAAGRQGSTDHGNAQDLSALLGGFG